MVGLHVFFIVPSTNQIVKPLIKNFYIFLRVHFLNDFLPLPLLNPRNANILGFLMDFFFTLDRILFSNDRFEKPCETIFDMHLHKPELFITLIFQNFGKQCNIMIISEISLDTCNDGTSPLDYKRFQPIFIIQVSVHKLLHGFDRKLSFSRLCIEFHFMNIDLIN